MSEYFSEPDGQALVYVADPGADVVEGTMTGPSLTIAALAKGTAPVTVTATDPGGLTAKLGFSVKVPNRGPVPEGTMEARTMEVGKAEAVDVSPFFSDPDGDELAYGVETSDAALVAVEVSGNLVEVTAVAKGPATVTVTATDTEGATATLTFAVTVPNRAPVVAEALPAQMIEVGEAATVDMSSFFSDPDGDDLAYAVVTGDVALAVAEVSGSVIMVTAVAKGFVIVKVTATDPEGGATAQSLEATVPNRAPVAKGAVEAQTTEVGEAATVDMSPFFIDPDGDALAYTVAGELAVTVAALARGKATMTVTATDIEGASATQSFSVMVPNRPPAITGEIPTQTVEVGEERTMDLSSYFTDPDGDPLAPAVEATDAAVVTASVAEGAVVLAALAKGEATVTVTVTDDEGLTAMQAFPVTVPNRAPVTEGAVEPQTIEVGETAAVDASSHFSDPDGDELSYTFTIPDVAVATIEPTGHLAVLTAKAKGKATATATDAEGLTATMAFAVTVPNQAPVAMESIAAQTVYRDSVIEVEVASAFTDPDGDALVYTVASFNPVGGGGDGDGWCGDGVDDQPGRGDGDGAGHRWGGVGGQRGLPGDRSQQRTVRAGPVQSLPPRAGRYPDAGYGPVLCRPGRRSAGCGGGEFRRTRRDGGHQERVAGPGRGTSGCRESNGDRDGSVGPGGRAGVSGFRRATGRWRGREQAADGDRDHRVAHRDVRRAVQDGHRRVFPRSGRRCACLLRVQCGRGQRRSRGDGEHPDRDRSGSRDRGCHGYRGGPREPIGGDDLPGNRGGVYRRQPEPIRDPGDRAAATSAGCQLRDLPRRALP